MAQVLKALFIISTLFVEIGEFKGIPFVKIGRATKDGDYTGQQINLKSVDELNALRKALEPIDGAKIFKDSATTTKKSVVTKDTVDDVINSLALDELNKFILMNITPLNNKINMVKTVLEKAQASNKKTVVVKKKNNDLK